MAMKGYALNKMCYSFNSAAAREQYLADPEAYFGKFKLNDEQKQACRNKNVLEMIAAVGNAIANNLGEEPYWKPFFDAYPPIRDWLDKHKPDVAINIYNDHGLGLFLDQMPTFAIGAAHEYINEDEGWGLPELPPFPGDAKLSWHIIEGMIEDEFDITSCQELAVDHGFTVPMQLFWPGLGKNPNMPRAIPISANTVQHPIPTLKRALDFGKSLGKAIRSCSP